jgi:hypothetical protein
MKNILGVIGLFLVCSASGLAQEIKKNDPKELAKKELLGLNKAITIDSNLAGKINELLIYKHENVAVSPERKEELAAMIEGKLKGSLTPEQFSKLKSNQVLFNDLKY